MMKARINAFKCALESQSRYAPPIAEDVERTFARSPPKHLYVVRQGAGIDRGEKNNLEIDLSKRPTLRT